MAGPYDTQAEAENWLNDYPYDHDDRFFVDTDGEDGSELKESYQPMALLREMLLDEGKKVKVSKKTARAVYHRDYMKTRNKPYRKYDEDEYDRKKGE